MLRRNLLTESVENQLSRFAFRVLSNNSFVSTGGQGRASGEGQARHFRRHDRVNKSGNWNYCWTNSRISYCWYLLMCGENLLFSIKFIRSIIINKLIISLIIIN